jgi:uncharacterized membrane protein
MITFAFGSADSPHFVLMIALAFDLVFLLMESRRYQIYDLWRRRFVVLNRHLIAPALLGDQEAPKVEGAPDVDAEGLRALANDLSNMVPHIGLLSAMAYRVRRNYGYLLLVAIGAWLLKLEMHPAPAASFSELLRRAEIGPIGGWVVWGGVAALALSSTALALSGPSERMKEWTEIPSPIVRLRSYRIGRARSSATELRAPRPTLEATE